LYRRSIPVPFFSLPVGGGQFFPAHSFHLSGPSKYALSCVFFLEPVAGGISSPPCNFFSECVDVYKFFNRSFSTPTVVPNPFSDVSAFRARPAFLLSPSSIFPSDTAVALDVGGPLPSKLVLTRVTFLCLVAVYGRFPLCPSLRSGIFSPSLPPPTRARSTFFYLIRLFLIFLFCPLVIAFSPLLPELSASSSFSIL